MELIKASDQVLKLTVISIAPEVAEKLENNGKLQLFIGISSDLDFPKILDSFPAFQLKRIVLDTFQKAFRHFFVIFH